ncbi:MAG TPA: hypothetical protein DIU39_10390 [Flavobacteriales bacterium]|nr:hypothetical protein [Flavobacteriales bacterium]|tara:strand:+ start:24148 stop:24534 length:387 start_codon:yes stop_codon:yes gene_type:complete
MSLIIETNISIIEELPNGIFKVTIKPGVEVDKKDLEESYRILLDLTGGKPSLFLEIFPPDSDATLEAREYFADKQRNKIKKAEAFIVKSLAHRLVAKFHLNFYKPEHKIKVFSNEADALKWLETFLEE